jgi:hypothetical protein
LLPPLRTPGWVSPARVPFIPAGYSGIELVDETARSDPVDEWHRMLDYLTPPDPVILHSDLEGFITTIPAGDEPPA